MKNSIFNEDIDASVGELSFDIGDLFFSHAGRRVNPHMTVLVFEAFGSRFNSSVGTELLRQQAKFDKILINEVLSFRR
jgi:hypothetical protein